MSEPLRPETRRVAFVSTRIAGTDGVSLEIAKWAHVIEKMGVECHYITAESDRPAERTSIIEEAHFNHPEIQDVSRRAFGSERRTSELTNDIMRLSRVIRDQLTAALQERKIDVVIAQNALTIPMNLPLGIAIVHLTGSSATPPDSQTARRRAAGVVARRTGGFACWTPRRAAGRARGSRPAASGWDSTACRSRIAGDAGGVQRPAGSRSCGRS